MDCFSTKEVPMEGIEYIKNNFGKFSQKALFGAWSIVTVRDSHLGIIKCLRDGTFIRYVIVGSFEDESGGSTVIKNLILPHHTVADPYRHEFMYFNSLVKTIDENLVYEKVGNFKPLFLQEFTSYKVVKQ